MLFDGTGGKKAKAATGSGLAKLTDGVLGTASAGDADSAVSDASDTAKGKVELATSAEVATGTDTTRAVTPKGAADAYLSKSGNLSGLADTSAARSTIGAAPLPLTASGVGQFITAVQNTAGSGYTLPSGGTWAWYMVYRSSSGTLNGHGAGVAAGGTEVRPGVSGNTLGGFAWRIA
jgi:hypothetical protein